MAIGKGKALSKDPPPARYEEVVGKYPSRKSKVKTVALVVAAAAMLLLLGWVS